MKTAATYVVAALILAALVWTGTYLYWHIRIIGAIRTMETQASGVGGSGEASDILADAGCRALPQLVGALDPSKNVFFQMSAAKSVAQAVEARAMRNGICDPAVQEQTKGWLILPEDSAAQRKAKCDAIQAYWSQNGALHHQSWRVWSSNCGAR